MRGRFERDARFDWKTEYHMRKTLLDGVQGESNAAEAAKAKAKAALEAAGAALQVRLNYIGGG